MRRSKTKPKRTVTATLHELYEEQQRRSARRRKVLRWVGWTLVVLLPLALAYAIHLNW